jgi:hypothetical protein
MDQSNFLTGNKLRLVAAAAVAGTTDVESAIIDTAGYDGVVFFATIAAKAANNYIQVEQDGVNSSGGMAALLGSGVVAAVNGDIVASEVKRPAKRYMRAVIKRGTSSATGDIYALLYGARKKPVDNNESSEIVSEVHATPAEGTA